MNPKTSAPAGTWPSNITATSLASSSVRLGQPQLFEGVCYWPEGRPEEKGRTTLLASSSAGTTRELTPAPYDVRSRVHEYGGAAYTVTSAGVFFVNAKDQGVYCAHRDQVKKIYQHDDWRFADLIYDPEGNRLIGIGEHHVPSEDSSQSTEPRNVLCLIDLKTADMIELANDTDFVASPALSSTGQLVWLSWNHPDMPWDQTTLNSATLAADSSLHNQQMLADGSALFQPQFGPDGQLYVVSDHNNWWNVYRVDQASKNQLTPITSFEAECGMPMWIFGMSTYGFADDRTLLCAAVADGLWSVYQVDLASLHVHPLSDWPYTAIEQLVVSDGALVALAASATATDAIVHRKLSSGEMTIFKSASAATFDETLVSVAQPVRFATSDGDEAYGFYYAPVNPTHELPKNTAPPLIVCVHGGPTTACGNGLNPRYQFWTSRGFAILDVNYRGSTGFGRDYRHSLRGQWGIYDVQDCVHGAQHLVEQGLANENQLFIMGGSAGGYTVLSALAYTDAFHGGISLYGIGDLKLLLDDTHKFEARYTDSLVGPWDEALYQARSPLYAAADIKVPVLFFQGTEDRVVPPNQAQTMVDALDAQEIPTACIMLEGEGHGFRRSESIVTWHESALIFYCQLMGETPPELKTTLQLLHQDRLQS